ncbi:MAG TPA: tRNA (N6-threonylcarbamoyladenosine(37)-N6)-methyltransferase TrmO [Polyangiaceae bacterium]|nr:tRNA (N6-threonylcarbamoyladenosine(37)-N6)-methyltransferase TrmO [Polyangiaceae bacterium]
MADERLVMQPIGIIRTPFLEQKGTPIQPSESGSTLGVVHVDPPYREALADLDGFERIWLLFCFDPSKPWQPRVVPYRDVMPRGLFATRAPSRPNAIGLSVVKLLSVSHDQLEVQGVDMLDGTPILDIKPYVPEFDAFPQSRAGWLDESQTRRQRADPRFQG